VKEALSWPNQREKSPSCLQSISISRKRVRERAKEGGARVILRNEVRRIFREMVSKKKPTKGTYVSRKTTGGTVAQDRVTLSLQKKVGMSISWGTFISKEKKITGRKKKMSVKMGSNADVLRGRTSWGLCKGI